MNVFQQWGQLYFLEWTLWWMKRLEESLNLFPHFEHLKCLAPEESLDLPPPLNPHGSSWGRIKMFHSEHFNLINDELTELSSLSFGWCLLWCWFLFRFSPNSFPHPARWHLNGFSSTWVWTWVGNLLDLNVFPQK